MFRNLLVAVDGSKHSRRAVITGADFAKHAGTKLTLVHVLDRPGGYQVPRELKAFNELEHIRITERDIIAAAGQEILASAERLARDKGAGEVSTRLEMGDPARVIAEIVERQGIDLVVLGRRGLGEVGGLLLGSVSHKVSQAVDCSCLTVK